MFCRALTANNRLQPQRPAPLPVLVLVLVVAMLSLALASCSPGGPAQHYDRYLARLQRTLDTTAPALPPGQRLPAPPRTGAMRLKLADSTVDGLDFLALSGCALQVTVGKRNSSLGKMASDSQRLLLELEYLQLAPACIDRLVEQDKTELAQTLELAQQQKLRQLPARVFNATLANREYLALWQAPLALGTYPEQTGSEVPAALGAINLAVRRWLAGDYRFDNREFEILLSEVAKGDAGALAFALSLQAEKLAAADALIGRRLQRGPPLCTAGSQTETANILDTVVAKYFVAAIQPWSAAVNRRKEALLPPVEELETLLQDALPDQYRRWMQLRQPLMKAWTDAPRNHVQQILRLRAPCRADN